MERDSESYSMNIEAFVQYTKINLGFQLDICTGDECAVF